MKILITNWFRKWLKRVNIELGDLISSAKKLNENPESSVSLGAGLYKVRVKRKHQGKSGGYRTLLIFKKDRLILYVYGFSKNEKDNIEQDELKLLKKLSKDILMMSGKELSRQINNGSFIDLEANNEK